MTAAMTAAMAAAALATAAAGAFVRPERAVVSFHWHCDGPPMHVVRVDDVMSGVMVSLDVPLLLSEEEAAMTFPAEDFRIFGRVWGERAVNLNAVEVNGTFSSQDGCIPLSTNWPQFKRIAATVQGWREAGGCGQWPDLSGAVDKVLCAPQLAAVEPAVQPFFDGKRITGDFAEAIESLPNPEKLRLLSVARQPALAGQSIPDGTLEALSGIQYLDLASCDMTGRLPVGPFPDLRVAWLRGNAWTAQCVPEALRGSIARSTVTVSAKFVDQATNVESTEVAHFLASHARFKYECDVNLGSLFSPGADECARVMLGPNDMDGMNSPSEGFEISAELAEVTDCTKAPPLQGKIALMRMEPGSSDALCGNVGSRVVFAEQAGAVAVVFSRPTEAKIGDEMMFAPSALGVEPDSVSIPVFRLLDEQAFNPKSFGTISGRLVPDHGTELKASVLKREALLLDDHFGVTPFCDAGPRMLGMSDYCKERGSTGRAILFLAVTFLGLAAYVCTIGFAQRIPHGSRRIVKVVFLAAQIGAFVLSQANGELFAPTSAVEAALVLPMQAFGLQPLALAKTLYCTRQYTLGNLGVLNAGLFILFAPLTHLTLWKQGLNWRDVFPVNERRDGLFRKSLAFTIPLRVYLSWFALPSTFLFVSAHSTLEHYDGVSFALLPSNWESEMAWARSVHGGMAMMGILSLLFLVIQDKDQQAETVREGRGHTSVLRTLLPSEMRHSGILLVAILSIGVFVASFFGFFATNLTKYTQRLVPMLGFLAVVTLVFRLAHSKLASLASSVLLVLPVAGVALMTWEGRPDRDNFSFRSLAASLVIALVLPLGVLFAFVFRHQDSVLDQSNEERLRLRVAAASDTEAGAKVADIFRKRSTIDTLHAFHNALEGALDHVVVSDELKDRGGSIWAVVCCSGCCFVILGVIRMSMSASIVWFSVLGCCLCLLLFGVYSMAFDVGVETSRAGSDMPIKLVKVADFREGVEQFLEQHGRVPRLDEMNLQPEVTMEGEFAFISHKWFSDEHADSPGGALTKALYLITGGSVKSNWARLGCTGDMSRELHRALKRAHIDDEIEWLWVDTFCVDQTSAETITADIRAIPDILLCAMAAELLSFNTGVYCESFWCCVEAAFLSFRYTPLIDLNYLEPDLLSPPEFQDRKPVVMVDASLLRFQTYRVESEIETLLASMVRPLVEVNELTEYRWFKLASLYNSLVQRANLLIADSDQRLPTFVRDGQVLLGQPDPIDVLLPTYCSGRKKSKRLAESTATFSKTGVDRTKRFIVKQTAAPAQQPPPPHMLQPIAAQPVMAQPVPAQHQQAPAQPGQQVMYLTPEQARAMAASGMRVTAVGNTMPKL